MQLFTNNWKCPSYTNSYHDTKYKKNTNLPQGYWLFIHSFFDALFSGHLTNVLRLIIIKKTQICQICYSNYNGHFSLCLWTGKGTVFLIKIKKNREESPCLYTERSYHHIMKGHFLFSLFEGLYMVIKKKKSRHIKCVMQEIHIIFVLLFSLYILISWIEIYLI